MVILFVLLIFVLAIMGYSLVGAFDADDNDDCF